MIEQIDSRYITLRLEKRLNLCYKEIQMIQYMPKTQNNTMLTAYRILIKKNNDTYSYFRMTLWSDWERKFDFEQKPVHKITVWHEASGACDFDGTSDPYNFIVPHIEQEVKGQYQDVDNTLLNKAIAERIGNYIVQRINDHEGGDK